MPAPESQTSSDSNPFIRALASSNRTTRARALGSLRTYLCSRRSFTSLDLLKLQKGLFYTLYMQDKPRQQQRLATELAELCNCFFAHGGKDGAGQAARENFLGWMTAFWTTMCTQWSGLDKARMDKFLLLVRLYVRAGFETLRTQKWDEGFVEAYVGVLERKGGPLSARDVKVPDGLRLHVLDVFVDELDRVDEKRDAPAGVLLGPLRRMAKESLAKSVRMRVKETLENERLHDWSQGVVKEVVEGAGENDQHPLTEIGEAERGDEDEEWTGIDD